MTFKPRINQPKQHEAQSMCSPVWYCICRGLVVVAAWFGISAEAAELRSPKDAARDPSAWMVRQPAAPDMTPAVIAPPELTNIVQTLEWDAWDGDSNPANDPTWFTICAGTNEGDWTWTTNVYHTTGTINFWTLTNWEYLYYAVFACNSRGPSPPSNIVRYQDWEPNAVAITSRKGVTVVATSTNFKNWTSAGITPQTNAIPDDVRLWRGDGVEVQPLRLWNPEKNHFGR